MSMTTSIVIPAHNGARYLKDAIRSALAQTRPADEILVVDDESTDATATIAQSSEWCGKVGYHFNSQTTGFVDAWNRAISETSGDFVTILHQDDLLHPAFLEQMIGALQRYPHVRHLYSACNYIDAHGVVTDSPLAQTSCEAVLYTGRDYARDYLRGVATNRHLHRCPGVLTNRALLINECHYRKEAGHIADDDFFLRVGAFTDVVGIAEPLASYRNHSESETGRLDLMTLRLARDYVFQADYHRGGETLLDTDGVAIVDSLAVRFINLLLFQAFAARHDDWADEALRLREAYEKFAHGVWDRYVPTWAKPMWLLAQSTSTKWAAGRYASMLKLVHAARSLLKNGLSD